MPYNIVQADTKSEVITMLYRKRLAIFSFLLCTFSNASYAVIIDVDFTGEVNFVDSALAGTFSVSNFVSGSLSYSTTDTHTSSLTSTRAIYDQALQSFSLTIGSYMVNATGGNILVDNDNQAGSSAPLRDWIIFQGVNAVSGASINGYDPNRLQFALSTETLTTLSDLDIPSVADLMNLWSVNNAAGNINFLAFTGLNEARFSLSTMNANIRSVPEPSTIALFGLAIIGLGLRRTRK